MAERVRPYYIFHAKSVKGTLHFQTPIITGVEIIEYLRGNTSGLAIPTYVVSAPDGLGKIAINPQYMTEEENDYFSFRTWENKIVRINK